MGRYVLLLLALCGSWACSRYVPVQSVGVVAEQKGTLTLRSTGYGDTRREAVDAAERHAVEQVLFRGLPGSQQTGPLVAIDEDAARRNNSRYFEILLDQGRYRTFILSSVPVSDYGRAGRTQRNITMEVCINLLALRSDLEAQGVIRKFGY